MVEKRVNRHVIDYSFAQLRSHILATWSPAYVANPNDNYLGDLWDELKRVESVGAWRSVTALAGQLLEASLKYRLVHAGVPPSEMTRSKGTLGALIGRAQQIGIFESPNAALTVGGSIFAALRMRNIASHASPWQKHPSEFRATASLSVVVCYIGYLFPRGGTSEVSGLGLKPPADAGLGWWEENATNVSLDTMKNFVVKRGAAHEDLRIVSGLIDMIVCQSSPRGLTGLAGHALSDGWVEVLRESFVRKFSDILANVGSGRTKNVQEFAVRLSQMGLRAWHSRIITLMLPHDIAALSYLLRRSPNTFSRYLYMCRRADPEIFEAMWDKGKEASLAKQFGRAIETRAISIGGVGKILLNVPRGLRSEVLSQNLTQLVGMIQVAAPYEALPLLDPKAGSNGDAEENRVLATAMADCIKATPHLAALSTIPRQLHRMSLFGNPAIGGVVAALLDRVGDMSPSDAQRTLWDIFAFSELFEDDVLRVAEKLAAEAGGLDLWNRLCVIGILVVGGREVNGGVSVEGGAALFATALFGENDRFRIARALIAFASLDGGGARFIDLNFRRNFMAVLRETATEGKSRAMIDSAIGILEGLERLEG